LHFIPIQRPLYLFGSSVTYIFVSSPNFSSFFCMEQLGPEVLNLRIFKRTRRPPQVGAEPRTPGARIRARLLSSTDEGQSLVEFAVCLPVLLLVVTGMCTFGIALNNYLELTDAVSTGSRLLAISRGQTTDPCATTSTAIYAAAPFLKKANYTFSFVLNGVTYSGISCSSGSTTTGAAGNLLQGTSAQVTVSYPCSLLVYGANLAPDCSLKAQTTELVQ